LEEGDHNTKFFHSYANQRRMHNNIWELKDSTGEKILHQADLEAAALSHFSEFYKTEQADLISQVKVAHYYPSFFSTSDARALDSQVTLKEIKSVLDKFAKDKSPRPDGWPVEFILGFFEQMGPELLRMIEETRIRGYVPRALNSTFIALIPKINSPE